MGSFYAMTARINYLRTQYHHLFISVDLYRNRNPYGYGKWSHNHRVYKTIKTIFVSLAPYKLFDILR